MAHKPVRTIGSFFKRPKDQRKKEDTRGTVYKIKRNDCATVYIGQTSRALKSRTKEHPKAASRFDKSSLLAQHSQKTGHSFDFENMSILHIWPKGTSSCFWKRGTPIRKRTQSTSTLRSVPRVYLNLKNSLNTFSTRVMLFVTYLPILPSLVIFAYVTDEGHRSDRNVLLFKKLFNQCLRYNYNFENLFFKGCHLRASQGGGVGGGGEHLTLQPLRISLLRPCLLLIN